MRTIVALTGPSAGGKGTLAEMLKEKGYAYFSCSDVLRDEATKRGWGIGRDTLQNLGDEMREKLGTDILPRVITGTPEFKHAECVVIDSIRHPDEIDYLQDFFDAKVIGVTAPLEVLFGFMSGRARDGDPVTFEEFIISYEREIGTPGGSAMQVEECLKKEGVVVIQNDGNQEILRARAERVFSDLGIEAYTHDEIHHETHHSHGRENHH